MALGLGLTAVRGDKNAESDSFGLVALCSIGPILSVLILGMIYNPEGAGYTPLSIPDIASTRELWLEFGHALPDYAKEVLLALAPILAFFVVFQVFFLKLRRKALVKILVGMLYTLVGLTLFLTGVNVGFMPRATTSESSWPSCLITGCLCRWACSSAIISSRLSRLCWC